MNTQKMSSTLLIYRVLPLFLGVLFTVLLSFHSINPSSFPEIVIGQQIWMQQNLNVDTFQNGDMIDQARNADEWSRCGVEKRACWCYYDFNPAKGQKYGKLYNWYAVNDDRKLAPEGWKIPTVDDWQILIDFTGGSDLSGNQLKCNNDWPTTAGLQNPYQFTALPGGFINGFGTCYESGMYGYWWSSTEDNELLARSLDLYDAESRAYISRSMKKEGLSVRCIKE
jgi:uncharacterized protein (TIGR02145 family)